MMGVPVSTAQSKSRLSTANASQIERLKTGQTKGTGSEESRRQSTASTSIKSKNFGNNTAERISTAS